MKIGNVIGENIYKYRKAFGLTQKQLSDMVGKSEITISRFENGTKIPSVNTLTLLADALNITVDDLLYGFITMNRELVIPENLNDFMKELSLTSNIQQVFMLNIIKGYIERKNDN